MGRIQKSSVSLFYYRPIQAKQSPIFWYDEFPQEGPWVRIDRDSSLTPTMIYSPLSQEPEITYWSPAQTSVLTESFWPENYGHALGDDFLPIYRLATSFGLWSRDLGVIFHPDCSRRGGAQRGCEHHEEMSKLLLDRPLESVGTGIWPGEGQKLCFENLLVGTRALGMGLPSEGSWSPFIAEIKSHLALPIYYRPSRQKITLFYKHGRRTILNYEPLQQRLQERFGVQVEIVNPASFTLEEQIVMMQDTTVVVSPCGGVSFSSVFLPKGVSAIFLEYVPPPSPLVPFKAKRD